VQDAGEPFFFNAAFPHENFSSGENWNHYSPLLSALFIVVDICIRYKRFPARLATIATRKQRRKPAQNGLLFFAAKPPKTKKRPLRQQKKLHFDFSKCSFPFGATGRIRTGEVLTRNQPLIPLKSSGIKPGETELPRIGRRRAAPSFSLPGKAPMKWSFFKRA